VQGELEDQFSNRSKFRDCAQEIESPYNRKRDALMDSDDDDFSNKRDFLEASSKQLQFAETLSASPTRPILNLVPINQNTVGNISQIKQNFFIHNAPGLRPSDYT
jgi:hypothetical protein